MPDMSILLYPEMSNAFKRNIFLVLSKKRKELCLN
jgi:hypothetical protein